MLSQIYNELTKKINAGEYDFFRFDQDIISKYCANDYDIINPYQNIVIIGFGASSLNTKAICSALIQSNKKIIYLDSLHKIEIDKKLNEIIVDDTIFFSISKSGNTNETYLLTKYVIESKKIDPKKIYVISARGDNLLFNLAKYYKTNHLPHDVKGCGRFNIISGSSCLPAMHLGVNIEKFLLAARKILTDFLVNGRHILSIASWHINNYKLHRNIYVMFNYCYQLDGFLQWKHQIFGESLGKGGFGITPIISNGTFDEHSQLQLYLEGPNNKFFELIKEGAADNANILTKGNTTHADNIYKTLVANDKSVNLEVFEHIDEQVIAKLIVETLLTTILIAGYYNINFLDQPAVDNCKIKLYST